MEQKANGADYRILISGGEGEIIEKKSRFIATVRVVESEEEAQAFIEEMKKKYFKDVQLSVQVDEEIKKRVKFRQHNLLRDPFIKDCDLIVCRNVLIYFTDEAKDEIFQKFYDCLKPGGVLFIGSTEQIMNYKEIGFLRKASFFYEKPLV